MTRPNDKYIYLVESRGAGDDCWPYWAGWAFTRQLARDTIRDAKNPEGALYTEGQRYRIRRYVREG